MSLFAISDLHLPLGVDKPMDVFGKSWDNYVERIRENWQKTVKDTDTVIINGDVSWATYLDEAKADFEFINSLNGTKVISRGNHDYWWETIKKLNEYKEKNHFDSINFLHNSAYKYEDYVIAVARGWLNPNDQGFTAQDRKIYDRECNRLKLSISEAKKISDKIIVALHFPIGDEMEKIIDDENVCMCIFGHLHGRSAFDYLIFRQNTYLVSADYLQFTPKKLI